jgi:Ca2+-binding RTX toxin-like protein
MATYTGTNLDTFKSGLDTALDTLQKAVNAQALGNSLPLLGDTLKNNAAAQFITKLQKAIDDELAKLPNPSAPTADEIEQVLNAAASKLGIFKDLQKLDSANQIEYVLKLGEDIATVSTPLATDIGLPNLGLKVSGNADTKIGYDFTIGFGLDATNGFFLDTVKDSLDLKLGVTTPNLAADASLGFLTFKAKDTGTNFNGDFAIDLKSTKADPRLFLSDLLAIGTNYQNLIDAKLKGGADVELNLGATTGVKGLPSVSTDLSVKWNFNGLTSADPANKGSFGDAPAIAFNHVTVDAGSAISDFIGPVLQEVKTITTPLKPAIDVLGTPLPVIGFSLIDLGGYLSQVSQSDIDSAKKLVKQLQDVIDLADAIPSNSDELKIDLGSFSLGGDIRATKAGDSNANATQSPTPPPTSGTTSDFLSKLKNTDPKDGLDLQFPLLTDPNTAVGLLLGKDVSLFTFQPPQLKLSYPITLPSIPVFGPVVLKFGGSVGATAGIKIGYDNKGLTDFQKSDYKDATQLLDGLYASKPTGGDNLSLTGEVDVSAGVGIGVVDITVGGGLRLTTKFDLGIRDNKGNVVDPNVRASDFAMTSPLCLFDPTGELDVIIFGQLSLDFGFFSFTQRLDIADIKLIDFSTGCDDNTPHYKVRDTEPDPVLAAKLAGRGIIDRFGTTNGDVITVTALTGYDGTTGQDLLLKGLDKDPDKTLAESAGKKYEKVKLVVIKGGDGNDTINLTGIDAAGQLSGGTGDDTIIGGNGSDFLIGGAGNNYLDGGEGKNNTVDYSAAPAAVSVNLGGFALNGYGGVDTLVNIQNAVGSKYNDTLIAGDADAVMEGGDGDDTLLGRQGDDVLMGGSGKNTLDGGGGTNTVSYLFAKGPIDVNLSSLNIGDSLPVIAPTDASVIYLSANSAVGGYGVVDDTIKNIQNLQGSTYDDILVAGNAAPTGTTYTSKNGHNYTGSYIDGSQGNDLIYVGAGSDVLDGGQGINWLSYALSTAAVTVNLKPIKYPIIFGGGYVPQSGGYAEGDIILAAKNKYTDNEGVDTNLSSFQNLEGSIYDDTLSGDGSENIIRGGAGKDTIYGGDDNDTLIGGAGADYLSGDAYTGTLRAELESALIADITQGGGNIASYADSPLGVTVNLVTHSGQRSDAEGDQLFGIQNLIGSKRADTFFGGNEFSNDFNTGLSSGGTDVVIGGTGHTNSLTVDYSLGDYGKGIKGGFSNTSANYGAITRYGSDGVSTLDAVNFLSIDRLFLTGTIQDDNITGSSNAKGDVIFASAGNDNVNGGGGNDYLDGGDGIDTLSDYLGDRSTSIKLIGIDPKDPTAKQFDDKNFADGFLTIKNFEVFQDITTGSGSSDRIVQPGRVNNTFIKAGSGSNYVDPGLGFDTVNGGLGGLLATRTLHVDYSQGDTGGGMQFYASSDKSGAGKRYISVDDLNGSAPLLDRVDFTNFDRFEVTGTSKDDYIQGGEGNDDLSGGSGGYDYLVGGRGNDTLRASSGGSTLQGTDNFDRGSDTDVPGEPGSIFGNKKIHTYNLAQDQDTLYGGAGADTFVLGDVFGSTKSIIDSIAPGNIHYAHSFYDGTNNDNDYANIVNFDPSKGDVIQLRNLQGYGEKYTIFNFLGTEILSLGYTDKNGAAKSDTLALITGNFTNLDLNSSAFKYVGDPYTPPRGPN